MGAMLAGIAGLTCLLVVPSFKGLCGLEVPVHVVRQAKLVKPNGSARHLHHRPGH